MGAWIETVRLAVSGYRALSHPIWVRGLKLSWTQPVKVGEWSHPIWVRGLKLKKTSLANIGTSRTLYGCVDWNCAYNHTMKKSKVAPYMGAWIETWGKCTIEKATSSRTLYGCVDWNRSAERNAICGGVAPYMGAWIETGATAIIVLIVSVAPYMGAWIETLL